MAQPQLEGAWSVLHDGVVLVHKLKHEEERINRGEKGDEERAEERGVKEKLTNRGEKRNSAPSDIVMIASQDWLLCNPSTDLRGAEAAGVLRLASDSPNGTGPALPSDELAVGTAAQNERLQYIHLSLIHI